MREPDGKGNGGCPIEGVWDRRAMRGERAEWAFRGPREVKSPEDGPRPPRAVVSVVIQEGRMDETKETRQRGGGAEKAGEKGGGCRGMRPWSRYIRAPVPCLCQGICVFMWNTGEPHRRERDGKKKERGREGEGRREKERESAQRAREESSPVKGKDEDGGKSQWPAKVCCPFVTRERVGTLERASDYAARTPGNKRQPSHHHHHHIATPPRRPSHISLLLVLPSLFLAPRRSRWSLFFFSLSFSLRSVPRNSIAEYRVPEAASFWKSWRHREVKTRATLSEFLRK